jgi:fructose-1,6-bisphosphatase/inositol monophosphatase family enzyme
MAAGIIIVKEAGGYITDLTGGIKMSYKTEILEANARINHRLLRLTKAITDEKKSGL